MGGWGEGVVGVKLKARVVCNENSVQHGLGGMRGKWNLKVSDGWMDVWLVGWLVDWYGRIVVLLVE